MAQLKKKKMKYEKQAPDNSILDIERAVFSLTKLHGDSYFKGPVHKFLTSPLLDSHGQIMDFLPQYGSGLADLSQDSAVPLQNAPSITTAICGAHSFL